VSVKILSKTMLLSAFVQKLLLLKGRKLSVWKWQKMLREVCLANYSLTFLNIDKAIAANAPGL